MNYKQRVIERATFNSCSTFGGIPTDINEVSITRSDFSFQCIIKYESLTQLYENKKIMVHKITLFLMNQLYSFLTVLMYPHNI